MWGLNNWVWRRTRFRGLKGSIFHYLLTYFWLHWVCIAVLDFLQSKALKQQAGAALPFSVLASHCSGFSCCGAWALGPWASVLVARRLGCSAKCGIFPDQGSNPCLLLSQANSCPLYHQGNPRVLFLDTLNWRFLFDIMRMPIEVG